MDGGVPLMSAGFNSISATDLTTGLSAVFELEISATLLFDHPTLDSIMSWFSEA